MTRAEPTVPPAAGRCSRPSPRRPALARDPGRAAPDTRRARHRDGRHLPAPGPAGRTGCCVAAAHDHGQRLHARRARPDHPRRDTAVITIAGADGTFVYQASVIDLVSDRLPRSRPLDIVATDADPGAEQHPAHPHGCARPQRDTPTDAAVEHRDLQALRLRPGQADLRALPLQGAPARHRADGRREQPLRAPDRQARSDPREGPRGRALEDPVLPEPHLQDEVRASGSRPR